jgi:hypothetical protein
MSVPPRSFVGDVFGDHSERVGQDVRVDADPANLPVWPSLRTPSVTPSSPRTSRLKRRIVTIGARLASALLIASMW